jgi:hypothetical protein
MRADLRERTESAYGYRCVTSQLKQERRQVTGKKTMKIIYFLYYPDALLMEQGRPLLILPLVGFIK